MFTTSRVRALPMFLLPVTLVVAMSTGLDQSAAAVVGDQQQRVVRSTVLMTQTGTDVTGDYTVTGSVEAANERCWVRRLVTLSTTTFDGETVIIGKKRTNGGGRFNFTWEPFDYMDSDGFYTASVDRLRTKGKRPITCSAASKTVQ